MQEEKARVSMQSSGRFIDTLIGQWMSRTGSNIPLQQTEEQVAENSRTQDGKQQTMHNHERVIQSLKRKLKESQEAEASLSASLEIEIRNKEEIQTKMNATWVYIENITEYFNYIRESLTSFQQHRANLSALYDNVIQKQQDTIQKLHLSDAKSKELDNHVAQLQNQLLLQEEKLQEAITEQNKLRRQLENSEYELQSQRNELVNAHAEEKLILVKEQQRLLLEYENLQSRLQIVEKEKCDIAKSAMQLENKLLFQEEKMQEALTEQNKLKKQAEFVEREFHLQKNKLADVHAEEKKMLIEKQQQLQLQLEDLQSQMAALEQDKNIITEIITQKDALISKLQNDVSTYKNQVNAIKTNYNEMNTKCEALMERQNMQEKELLTKTERIQYFETMLSTIKQRETGLINDVNRIEKKLTKEIDYSKNLENKLSCVQSDLQHAHKQNADMQKALERNKSITEFTNIELQQQIKALQKEKEEIIKRETTKTKNTETLYENAQTKHIEEISALKNNYESRLVELKKTVEYLNDVINGIKKENKALNMSLAEKTTDNIDLKKNYEFVLERNKELEKKSKENMETVHLKSIDDQIFRSEYSNIQFNTMVSHNQTSNNDGNNPLSSQLVHESSIKKQSQNEQEAEVTSMSKKFFKSRSVQPRTYGKRRKD